MLYYWQKLGKYVSVEASSTFHKIEPTFGKIKIHKTVTSFNKNTFKNIWTIHVALLVHPTQTSELKQTRYV